MLTQINERMGNPETTYMTVLIPDSCWNICRPQPTMRALRVGPWWRIRKITRPPKEQTGKNQHLIWRNTQTTHVPSFLSDVGLFMSLLFLSHRNPSPPPDSFSSSSMLVLMVLYSESTLWPPLIRLRTWRASSPRPFWRSQRGLSGRKKKPKNCSTAGTTDKPSMYLQHGEKQEESRGGEMLKETSATTDSQVGVWRLLGSWRSLSSSYITSVWIMNRWNIQRPE